MVTLKLKNGIVLSFCIFLLTACSSCDRGNSKFTRENYICDTLVNESAIIISEVDSALQVMADGIVQKDAEKIFSIFKENTTSHYIRQGHIYPDIKTAEEQYARSFAGSNTEENRKFSFTQKHYDVLSGGAVLFTGTGVIESRTKKKDARPWVIVYTILWIKENMAWKAANMHISWEKR